MKKGELVVLMIGIMCVISSGIFTVLNNGIMAIMCWLPIIIIWGAWWILRG